MNDPSVGQAIAGAASNPKVATAVAVGASSAGMAEQFELITGIVAQVSVWLGACTAAVVLAVQVLKLMRTWRAWRDDRPAPQED